jgi:hypothetical protein
MGARGTPDGNGVSRHAWRTSFCGGRHVHRPYIRAAKAQREALLAVADQTISDQHIKLITEAVLSLSRSVEKQRNDLAHGLLGWSFDLPGNTLWVESKDIAVYEASSWFRLTAELYDKQTHNHDKLEQVIYYYDNKDFERLLKDVTDALNALFTLYGILRYRDDSTSSRYCQLSAMPQVGEALSRLLKDRKNTP